MRDDSVADPFFADRDRRRVPGVTRSLARARAFAPHLGIDLSPGAITTPILSIVGSKGKGTTATYASATLAAAGLRVGTLTSPGLRSNRERIRVDGVAVGDDEFAAIAARLARALEAAEATLPDEGYLSPTGLFTLSAVRHFLDVRCDVLVLEAGMGGMSDEISLVDPAVVAVTTIFGEHLGILGDSIAGIAENKLGVVRDSTSRVVSLGQPHAEAAAVVARVAGDRLVPVAAWDDPAAETRPGVPPGVVGANARLGIAAANELLALTGRPEPDPARLGSVLSTVRLPGRLSVHRLGQTVIALDSAINSTGAMAARRWCEELLGGCDAAVVCVPDDKDGGGVLAALEGLRVITVRLDSEHLHFEGQAAQPLLADVDLTALGSRVLCLGTVSFVGAILDLVDAPTSRLFDATALSAVCP